MQDIDRQIKLAYDYMDERRRIQSGVHPMEDGSITVKFKDDFVRFMADWTNIVRGEKRLAWDDMNDDTGLHRIKEGVIGKLAECACRIAGPVIPLERVTGEFMVDLEIYESGDTDYDCDFNDSVTHKLSGDWSERNGHTGWIAAKGDAIRKDPKGKKIVLSRYVDMSTYSIVGWVDAELVMPYWSPCIKLETKDCLYYNEYADNAIYTADRVVVTKGGIKSLIVPITQEIEVEA